MVRAMGVSPAGWMPVRVGRSMDGDTVDWVYTEGIEFSDPFFDQTVERALRTPFRVLFRRQTPLDDVEADAGDRARDPDGLVLHVSRCGSTLLASCLRARAGTCVLSEPGPVETVLAGAPDRETRIRRLRSIIRAMAPDDPGSAYVVKLDAWATLDLPEVLDAFPEMPWVFVSRDPREVLASHQRHWGYHVIPGTLDAARVGLGPEAATWGLDEYAAGVLGRILTRAAEGARRDRGRMLLIDHRDLPQPGVELAAEHFGFSLSGADRRAIAAVASRDAKNPALAYADDRSDKLSALSPEAAAAVERRAGPAYRSLLELARS